MSLIYNVYGKTDVGLVRSGNEDYLHIDEDSHVFAVFDGMGGHQAGEVASMTASKTVWAAFNHFRAELLADPDLSLEQSLPPSGELLVKSVRLANRVIHNKASRDSTMTGMGTTVVSLALEDDIMAVAHVGDSRAYRLDERQLMPLTSDHSWVSEMQQKNLMSEEEALHSVGKNVITRALGVRGNVEVDCRLVRVRKGEKFILCSDGLCGFADDDEIFNVAEKQRDDLPKMVDDLVQMANDRGGNDNVTVIVLEITEVGESSYNEMEVFTLPAESDSLLGVEDTWLDRFAEAEKKEEAPDPTPNGSKGSSGGGNKFLLTLIFAVFIIVAFFIVYFSTSGR